MDRTLNLSVLHKLLHDTLLITEQVKEVLKRNCEEAAFALKPWPVKIVEKREDGCTCNCKKVAVESEVEEIAAGIDRAITLAQDLREKVKLDVAPQKRLSWKSPTEKASSSASVSDNRGRKTALRTDVTQKINVSKSAGGKSSSTALQNDAATSVASRKTSAKKQSRTSPASGTVKSKSERNFILENKLNIKKMVSLNKPQAGVRDSNSTPRTSKRSLPPTALAPELNSLIHKMVQKFTESTLDSPSEDSKTSNCPLHSDNQFVERTIMVNAAEALRHFNVPNEIVKTLRASHIFLKNTNKNNLNITKEDKTQKSINNFLKEFEVMNTSIQDNSGEMSQLIDMMHESISLFNNIFTRKFDPTQLNDVQNWITKSKAILKSYNTENITEDHIERPTGDLTLTREWMSNGVWNIICMKHFKSLSEAHCVRYNNEKQLLSLYEAVQKLQRTEYLNTLIQIILRDVIPAIKSNIDPASAEYARTYKTMIILCQGLNPEVPVLVRTDS